MICPSDDLGFVRFAELKDLSYVVDLSKKESKALGFIPKIAYEAAITGIKKGKRWSDVCNDKLFVIECNGDLVGFCLASFGLINQHYRKGKIAQICLQSDARLLQRGRMLLDQVVEYGKNNFTFGWSCGCADDLESNVFWSAMGWQLVNQRFGISSRNTWKQTSKRKVNIYMYSEMDLFLKKN